MCLAHRCSGRASGFALSNQNSKILQIGLSNNDVKRLFSETLLAHAKHTFSFQCLIETIETSLFRGFWARRTGNCAAASVS